MKAEIERAADHLRPRLMMMMILMTRKAWMPGMSVTGSSTAVSATTRGCSTVCRRVGGRIVVSRRRESNCVTVNLPGAKR